MEKITMLIDHDELKHINEKLDRLLDAKDINERLMDAKEAAEFLGVKNEQVVYRLVRQGKIPVIRMGHLVRFSRSEILKSSKFTET